MAEHEPAARAVAARGRSCSTAAGGGLVVLRRAQVERPRRRTCEQLNPVHVVIAGVLAAALFVVALVVLVSWVLSSGVAR